MHVSDVRLRHAKGINTKEDRNGLFRKGVASSCANLAFVLWFGASIEIAGRDTVEFFHCQFVL